MKKFIRTNYHKNFYLFLFVLLPTLSCSTVGTYYDSSASIPRMSFNKKTDMKIISTDDSSYLNTLNFGVIAATDIVNGKKLNYILISPIFDAFSYEIESFSLNNSSVLYLKHVRELVSVLDEAIKVLSKNFPEDGTYMTYTITPENLIQKTGEHSIKYYPTFNLRFQCTKDNSSADLSVGEDHNYVFPSSYLNPLSKSLKDFKTLLINAMNELKKREGK